MAGAPVREALILCGGLGTRLQAVVSDRPKPMADVGGRPFLEVLLSWAAAQGVKKAVLSVGHKADMVRAHFAKLPRGLAVEFCEEKSPLGTGGALALALPRLSRDPVLVMNGDTFCGVSLPDFLASHEKSGAAASLVAAPVGGRTDGGVMRLAADGRIEAFEEKKALGGAGWINAGIIALTRRALDLVPRGRPCSLERDVFPLLLKKGFHAFKTEAPLYDIGTPERLEAFKRDLAAGKVTGLK